MPRLKKNKRIWPNFCMYCMARHFLCLMYMWGYCCIVVTQFLIWNTTCGKVNQHNNAIDVDKIKLLMFSPSPLSKQAIYAWLEWNSTMKWHAQFNLIHSFHAFYFSHWGNFNPIVENYHIISHQTKHHKFTHDLIILFVELVWISISFFTWHLYT